MSKDIINFTFFFFMMAEVSSCDYCTIKVVLMMVVPVNTHSFAYSISQLANLCDCKWSTNVVGHYNE